jgi:protease I
MANELTGKRIAFLATDGVEQSELQKPWDAARNEGADVELISLNLGSIQGVSGMERGITFAVTRTVDDANPDEYDGLVLPGGVADPDKLRVNRTAVEFVQAFVEAGKPVAAICHGPWTLVEAGVVRGRTLTSWPSLKTDIRNAGGSWLDAEVHVDRGLVTSRKPDDLPAFCAKMIEEFAEGVHSEQRTAATTSLT